MWFEKKNARGDGSGAGWVMAVLCEQTWPGI
jgi:hypothetical protein